MIISHEAKFVFVHIPKCAGTFLRQSLSTLDSYDGRFTARIDLHPELGMLDYVHIPLFVLEEYFSEEFDCLINYQSVAVIRDPMVRFRSSVSQYLDKQTNTPLRRHSQKSLGKAIDDLFKKLHSADSASRLMPHNLIHFQRQVDYVFFEGRQIITDLYPLHSCDQIMTHPALEDFGLADLMVDRGTSVALNDARVYRNNFVRLLARSLNSLSPNVAPLFPSFLKGEIRRRLFTQRDAIFGEVFDDQVVTDFISDFYRDDLVLWASLEQQNASKASNKV